MAADRRYTTRKKPFEGGRPHVLRVRILEKYMDAKVLDEIITEYKEKHRVVTRKVIEIGWQEAKKNKAKVYARWLRREIEHNQKSW